MSDDNKQRGSELAAPHGSATGEEYEYNHLTKEIISLLPDKPPSMGELLLGESKLARRLAQLNRCYGTIVGGAMREAYMHKYKAANDGSEPPLGEKKIKL